MNETRHFDRFVRQSTRQERTIGKFIQLAKETDAGRTEVVTTHGLVRGENPAGRADEGVSRGGPNFVNGPIVKPYTVPSTKGSICSARIAIDQICGQLSLMP